MEASQTLETRTGHDPGLESFAAGPASSSEDLLSKGLPPEVTTMVDQRALETAQISLSPDQAPPQLASAAAVESFAAKPVLQREAAPDVKSRLEAMMAGDAQPKWTRAKDERYQDLANQLNDKNATPLTEAQQEQFRDLQAERQYIQEPLDVQKLEAQQANELHPIGDWLDRAKQTGLKADYQVSDVKMPYMGDLATRQFTSAEAGRLLGRIPTEAINPGQQAEWGKFVVSLAEPEKLADYQQEVTDAGNAVWLRLADQLRGNQSDLGERTTDNSADISEKAPDGSTADPEPTKAPETDGSSSVESDVPKSAPADKEKVRYLEQVDPAIDKRGRLGRMRARIAEAVKGNPALKELYTGVYDLALQSRERLGDEERAEVDEQSNEMVERISTVLKELTDRSQVIRGAIGEARKNLRDSRRIESRLGRVGKVVSFFRGRLMSGRDQNRVTNLEENRKRLLRETDDILQTVTALKAVGGDRVENLRPVVGELKKAIAAFSRQTPAGGTAAAPELTRRAA